MIFQREKDMSLQDGIHLQPVEKEFTTLIPLFKIHIFMLIGKNWSII
jgi:hypothetical protein